MTFFRLSTFSQSLFSSPFWILVLLVAVGVGEAAGQEGSVRIEENLRSEPNGTIIGQLSPGTRFVVVGSEGSWTQVTIEGYLWAQSLQVRSSGSFDLIISAPNGENLRDAPSGQISGRLLAGTLLEEVERIPGWIRVRRTAWIWGPSLSVAATAPAARSVNVPPPAQILQATEEPSLSASDAEGMAREGWVQSGIDGAEILATPNGESLGRSAPGAELRVVTREGNWARVQLEGWIWMPTLSVGGGETSGDPTILTGVRIRDLSANFDRYRGRLVEVELQFISVERAEQIRSDFYAGEPFLLTRSTDSDRSFVYVAVPAGMLAEVQSLAPLETIRVVGRARSGSAAFTGSPILDLVELVTIR